jgi:hypothetical protein
VVVAVLQLWQTATAQTALLVALLLLFGKEQP